MSGAFTFGNGGGGVNNPFGQPQNNQQQQPAQGGGLFGGGQQQQQQAGGGIFGQANNAAGGGSIFGAPAQQAQPSLFGAPQQQQQQQPGGGGMFGAQPAAGGNAFGGGGGGMFGQPQNNAAGGAFGQPRPGFGAAGGGLFGNTNTQQQNAFGAPNNAASPFGAPAANTGGFGANNAGGGLFGAPKPAAPIGFGATQNTGGLFGAKPAAPLGTNAFGSNNNLAGMAGASPGVPPAGSAAEQYVPVREKEGPLTSQVWCTYHSISVMPTYRGCNFDELRLADYAANRKTAAAAPVAGAFGNNTGAFGGAFGQPQQQQQQQAPAFGQPQPATGGFGFGQPQPAANTGGGLFGNNNAAPATNAFGQPQPQAGASLFGQPAQPAPSLFGQPPAAAPQQGMFGQPQPAAGGNIFGNPGAAPNQLAAGTGTFNTSAFGAPQQPKPNNFGFGGAAPAPAQASSPFGAPQPAAPTTSLFGTNTFGNTQPTAPTAGFGGAFGGAPQQQQPAQASSLFGGLGGTTNQQATSSPFGGAQQPAAGGLFGTPAGATAPAAGASGFGLFKPAAPAPAPNPFGGTFNTASAPAQNNVFGVQQSAQTNTQAGGLFGLKPNEPAQGAPGSFLQNTSQFGQNNAQNGGGGLFSSQNGQNNFGQNQSVQGGNNLGNSTLGQSTAENQFQSIFSHVAVSSRPSMDPPRVQVSINSPDPYGMDSLFANSPGFPLLKVTKVLPPFNTPLRRPAVPTLSSKARTRPSLASSQIFQSSTYGSPRAGMTPPRPGAGLFDSPVTNGVPASIFTPRQSIKKLVINKPVTHTQLASSVNRVQLANSRSAAAERDSDSNAGDEQTGTPEGGLAKSGGRNESMTKRQSRNVASPPKINFSELQEGEYWTWPKLNELSNMGADELRSVQDFMVGRQGYGKITFLSPVDLSTVDELKMIPGTLVTFNHMSCEVYPDADTAREQGEGLNQPAKIELEGCWTKSKATKELIKDPANPAASKFERKLKDTKNTHFVSYNIGTGLWVFRVDHFTRYGVDDEDEYDLDAQPSGGDHSTSQLGQDEDDMGVTDPEDVGSMLSASEDSSDTSSEFESEATPRAQPQEDDSSPEKLPRQKRGLDQISADFGKAGVDQPEMFDNAKVERSTFGVPNQSQRAANGLFRDRPSGPPTRKYLKVSMKDSVLLGRDGFCGDVLANLGRSSRSSWTATNLACPAYDDVRTWPVTTHDVQPALHLLALQQKHRDLKVLDGVPLISTASSLRFRDFAAGFATRKDNAAKLWRLGHALFDELDLPAPAAELTGLPVERFARKVAFSRWLEDSVGPQVDREATQASAGPKHVFALLSGHRIEDAVEAAIQSSDLRLALLVSQIGGGEDFRLLMSGQLAGWREQAVDQHMSGNVRRVYALLAGLVDVLPGSSGSRTGSGRDLDISEGLDWQRRLGLQLWYGCKFDQSLEEAFKTFSDRLHGVPASGRPRLPSPTGAPAQDALYTLLKVFCDRDNPLTELLDPRTVGHEVQDVSTQWHLFMLLSTVFKVGLNSPDHLAARLTVDYASQMEAAGCWIEAIFVLLHLVEPHARVKAVKEVLFRQPANAFAAKGVAERLIDDLKIPSNWLAEAEANILHASGQIFAEFKSCLQAGLFNRAHDLLIQDLVPELVLHQDSEKAKELLAELEHERVARWDIGGQIIADYIECHERVPILRSQILSDDTQSNDLRIYHQKLVRVNEELPRIFLSSKEKPMTWFQKAALRQMMGDVQRMVAGLAVDLGVPRVPVSDILPEADRLRLISNGSRESFMKKLEVACE